MLPLLKGHFEWADFFREAASTADEKVSVALLDYSECCICISLGPSITPLGLCPENVYPTQMRQAASALRHLVSLGYSPSKVGCLLFTISLVPWHKSQLTIPQRS